MIERGRARGIISLVVLLIGTGMLTPIVQGQQSTAGVQMVRFGITPFFDYQPWVIAHELALDKEQGLRFELTNLSTAANAIAALRHGSIDVASSCHVCNFPFYKSVATLRSWIITDQFKGFIVVGRKGQTETYADLARRFGAQQAKDQLLRSFKGRSFAIKTTSYEPLLKAALSQIGLSLADVKVIAFPDDAEAALAFEKGVGDYYMGSLPQEIKLLSSSPDKYVRVGGHEILGPAGLWYSVMDSAAPWLARHHDAAMKILAVWYRTVRYLHDRPDQAIPLWTKAINERAAASFTPEQVKFTTDTLLFFPTLVQANLFTFNPASDIYWRRSVDYYTGPNKDKLPGDFSVDRYYFEQRYFVDFLRESRLVAWVNAPLR